MKRNCVIIDVENTLVDVSIRKHSILTKKNSLSNLDINAVRNDRNLERILGKDTESQRQFFELYNNPETILQYPAPLFIGAKEVINRLINIGIEVFLITGRPTSFQNAIIDELSANGLDMSKIQLYCKSEQDDHTNFKKNIIKQISQDYSIIVYVEDRAVDIERIASLNFNIPTILFFTFNNQLSTEFQNTIAFQVCTDWKDIERTILLTAEGNEEIKKLRKLMIDTYTSWLQNMNFTLSICVAIATILCGLSGKILLKCTEGDNNVGGIFTIISMGFVFICSLLSLIFSIRGFTSKRTSGKDAGKEISIRRDIKLGIAVLTGNHKKAKKQGDPISKFEEFRGYDEPKKSTEHIKFFHDSYNSYDPDALWNERLFSIRASNYAQVYGQRFASTFLIWAIVLMGIWVMITVVKYLLIESFA